MFQEDIKKYCYFNHMRFGSALKKITSKYENNSFINQVQNSLSELEYFMKKHNITMSQKDIIPKLIELIKNK